MKRTGPIVYKKMPNLHRISQQVRFISRRQRMKCPRYSPYLGVTRFQSALVSKFCRQKV